MLKKVGKYRYQILSVVLSVLGFALIRNYENQIFYDPFLNFFKGSVSEQFYPEINELKLFLNLFLRYVLNTILSLIIIYSLFKNKDFVKLASAIYIIFFVALLVLLAIAIKFFSDQYMLLFYIRRFMIQPLFLLLFVPGFYFQQQKFK